MATKKPAQAKKPVKKPIQLSKAPAVKAAVKPTPAAKSTKPAVKAPAVKPAKPANPVAKAAPTPAPQEPGDKITMTELRAMINQQQRQLLHAGI